MGSVFFCKFRVSTPLPIPQTPNCHKNKSKYSKQKAKVVSDSLVSLLSGSNNLEAWNKLWKFVCRAWNKDFIFRSNFWCFWHFIAPGLFKRTQFCFWTRGILPFSRGIFAPCPHLFQALHVCATFCGISLLYYVYQFLLPV